MFLCKFFGKISACMSLEFLHLKQHSVTIQVYCHKRHRTLIKMTGVKMNYKANSELYEHKKY